MAILRFTGPLAFPGPRGRVCPVLLAALFLLPAGAGPAGAQVQPTVPAAPGTPPAPPALGNVSGAAAADPTVTGVGLTTHLERIDRQEQLAELALPLDEALYVKFVLDRRTDRLYYVNTPLFPFHYHFVLEVLQGGRPGAFPDIHAFGDACYRGEQRPYLLGTLVVPPRGAPHFQLLEQDVPSAALIRQGWLKLRSTFGLAGGRLSYRPLSQAQSELLPQLGDLPVIAALTTADAGATQLLNPGKAVGQLTVIPAGADLRQQPPGPEQIVVLQDLPMDITPVAGILCATFSTPLSHVNLRARSWGIPHMAFRQLPPEAAALDGRWVLYEVTASGATLRQASPAEVEAARQRRRAGEGKVRIPRADLARRDLPALAELGAADAISAGAKAANLGVLFGARGETFDVPPGLAIPFGHYLDFLAHNQLAEAARRMAEDASLADDPRRCLRLENLQHQIRQGRHTEAFRQALLARVQRLGLQGGLFVRSSTNAEDLEGFSGAGLYDTIPNVRGDEALLDAVRQVWASVWNCRAWQERQFWQIAHAAVYPAVVVQQAAAADGAGVLITKDLTGQSSEPTITINAKRGLGLRVVDGQTLPEQILYARGSGRLQVTSRSTDDVALVLAPGGGVVEQRSTPGAVVLDEPLVRALDRAAAKVERLFPASGPLDLEWVVSAGRVLLVQVRPYVEAGAR